jgi:hypothetical protein
MDAWQLTLPVALYLSLDMPFLLELPWIPVVLVSFSACIALYLWEMREIKRLEQGATRPLSNGKTRDGLTR